MYSLIENHLKAVYKKLLHMWVQHNCYFESKETTGINYHTRNLPIQLEIHWILTLLIGVHHAIELLLKCVIRHL